MYCIYNGKYYLTNEFKPVDTYNLCKEFATVQAAQNFLDHSPKSIRNLQYAVVDRTIINDDYTIMTDTIPDKFDPNYFNNADISDICRNYQKLLQQRVLSKDYFSKLHSDMDNRLQDLMHAAEFFNLNASDGYTLYKQIHEARCTRRYAKDMLTKIEIISTSSLVDWLSGTIMKRFEGLESREYSPRTNIDIFGGQNYKKNN